MNSVLLRRVKEKKKKRRRVKDLGTERRPHEDKGKRAIYKPKKALKETNPVNTLISDF